MDKQIRMSASEVDLYKYIYHSNRLNHNDIALTESGLQSVNKLLGEIEKIEPTYPFTIVPLAFRDKFPIERAVDKPFSVFVWQPFFNIIIIYALLQHSDSVSDYLTQKFKYSV